jgi:nitroreductase
VLLIVVYDARKRVPASEGDVLGFISMGCVMENMWLMAQSLGINVHVLSVFAGHAVEKEVKQILSIPIYMKVAFALRMGHPISKRAKHLRVRRDLEMFTYHNRFGNKGLG